MVLTQVGTLYIGGMNVREIKFRAWDKELKRMFYADIEQLDNGIAFLIDGHFDDEEPVWMQYTGLKDRNDEEIYEGDIVVIDTQSYEGCENRVEGVVEYSDELACYFVSDGENGIECICNIEGSYTTIIEVLGNIYEDSELLQDEDVRVLGIEAQVYGK